MSQQQKEAALKSLTEVWNTKQYDNLDKLFVKKMKLHIRQTTVEITHNQLKDIIDKWKDTFPDLRFEILHVVAESDKVAINTILHGTPSKKWKSYEPSGKSMAVPHSFFFEFENEKIAEVWEVNDFTVLDGQLL